MLKSEVKVERSPAPGLGLLVPILAIAAAALLVGAGRTTASPPPTGLPACEAADRPAPHRAYDEWDETMLDPALTLGPDYRPPDLGETTVGGRRVTLRAFVVAPLKTMLDAAATEGHAISVTSAYRSFGEQERLVAASPGLNDEVARPGHSEHQLGTTVDLAGGHGWLRVNASRYGFLLSFPAGRGPQWTCYRDEPWHFRYFGPKRAQAIEQSGLSPREWLWARQPEAADDSHGDSRDGARRDG